MSPLDFSRCIEYVRKNRLGCNVLNISSKQLLTISVQHLHTEAELKKVKEYIARLRKQKKMWYEKLIRTISQDIFDIEELKRIEAEEAVGIKGTTRSLVKSLSDTIYKPIDTRDRYHPGP